MFTFTHDNGQYRLFLNGRLLLSESRDEPMLWIGRGEESVDMYRGNYKIEDYVTERLPLHAVGVIEGPDSIVFDYGSALFLRLTLNGDLAELRFECPDPSVNRLWLRLCAEEDECCWGCGEQMSYFNLRGRHFPLWTSEPGVGRDKSTYVTWRSDVENRAGGDYYNTNFPQPTFVSSRHYYLHADTTAYADFDFRHGAFHELQF